MRRLFLRKKSYKTTIIRKTPIFKNCYKERTLKFWIDNYSKLKIEMRSLN
jgi:hypothetical protein